MSENLSPDMAILSAAFDGASLKVERAKSHINDFEAIIKGLGAPDRQGFTIERDEYGGESLLLQSLGSTGVKIPLVLGDAVHNLRVSLDHIWAGLCRSINPSVGKPPGFPFHETWKNLEDLIAKSSVKVAFPETEWLILEDVKPYSEPGGDHVLWSLTKLDNLDKHNLLIPTLNINSVQNVRINTGLGEIHFENCSFGDRATLVRSVAPIKYEQDGAISVTPVFSNTGSVLPGEPVIPTLVYLTEAVSKTVSLFKSKLC